MQRNAQPTGPSPKPTARSSQPTAHSPLVAEAPDCAPTFIVRTHTPVTARVYLRAEHHAPKQAGMNTGTRCGPFSGGLLDWCAALGLLGPCSGPRPTRSAPVWAGIYSPPSPPTHTYTPGPVGHIALATVQRHHHRVCVKETDRS